MVKKQVVEEDPVIEPSIKNISKRGPDKKQRKTMSDEARQRACENLRKAREIAFVKKKEMGDVSRKLQAMKVLEHEKRKIEAEKIKDIAAKQLEEPKVQKSKIKRIVKKYVEESSSEDDDNDDEEIIEEVIIKKNKKPTKPAQPITKATPPPEPLNVVDNNVNMLLRNKLLQQREQNYMKLLQNMM